jgi:hypothetical protein
MGADRQATGAKTMARDKEIQTAQHELRWHWWDSQEEIQARYPRERPPNPEVGAGWFNEATASFCVWDGREWVLLPVD